MGLPVLPGQHTLLTVGKLVNFSAQLLRVHAPAVNARPQGINLEARLEKSAS